MHLINQEKSLVELFGENIAPAGKLTQGIYAVIRASFLTQKMNNPTRAEVVHRFEACVKWAKVLRADLQWGIERIVDELPNVLKAELSGQQYQPPSRLCWIPSDGN